MQNQRELEAALRVAEVVAEQIAQEPNAIPDGLRVDAQVCSDGLPIALMAQPRAEGVEQPLAAGKP